MTLPPIEWCVYFIDGPLKGRKRTYVSEKRPEAIHQPVFRDGLHDLYVYTVVGNTAHQSAMWHIGERELSSAYYYRGPQWYAAEYGPTRADFNNVMHDEHGVQMRAFVDQFNALAKEYKIEAEHDGGFGECEGVWFQLGHWRWDPFSDLLTAVDPT